MQRRTARRIRIAFGALVVVFVVLGLATGGGSDPVVDTFGEAGRHLEEAASELRQSSFGCPTGVAAGAGSGAASVQCMTPHGVRLVLVGFADVRVRDEWVVDNCAIFGGPMLIPIGRPWVLATYSATDLAAARDDVRQAGVDANIAPRCKGGGVMTFPVPTPS